MYHMLLISAQLYSENLAQCVPQELVCIVPHAAFVFTLDHANAALCMSYQTQHLRALLDNANAVLWTNKSRTAVVYVIARMN